jgi:hypothetical protein
MNSISFVGKESGDGECFCWEVDTDTRCLIIGKEAFEEELGFSLEMAKDGLREIHPAHNYLYPNEVLRSIGCTYDKKYRFTITAEEIDE